MSSSEITSGGLATLSPCLCSPPLSMSLGETSFGIAKRLRFIQEIVAEWQPRWVLDIGCGTGTNLTIPLARSFPATGFLGVDVDVSSIEFARGQNNLPNLEFGYPQDAEGHAPFDLVIASEVLEHVDEPEAFLASIRDKLTDSGRVVVTVPNGYGPFECMALLEALLHLSGILGLYRRVRRAVVGVPPPAVAPARESLAVSPHINFFTQRRVVEVAASSGFRMLVYRPRTFLCGFLLDQLVDPRHIVWNANVADVLPPWLNSGWMLLFEKAGLDSVRPAYRPGWFSRLRRRIYGRRWGQHQ